MTDWGGLGCSPYCLGLKWEVEVGGMWWAWDCSFPPRIYIYFFLIFELFIHVYVFLNAFFIIRKKSTLSLCACCYFKIEPEPCGDFPIVGNLSICMGKSIF